MCFVSQLSGHFLAERFLNQSVSVQRRQQDACFDQRRNGENGSNVFHITVRLLTVGKHTTLNVTPGNPTNTQRQPVWKDLYQNKITASDLFCRKTHKKPQIKYLLFSSLLQYFLKRNNNRHEFNQLFENLTNKIQITFTVH